MPTSRPGVSGAKNTGPPSGHAGMWVSNVSNVMSSQYSPVEGGLLKVVDAQVLRRSLLPQRRQQLQAGTRQGEAPPSGIEQSSPGVPFEQHLSVTRAM